MTLACGDTNSKLVDIVTVANVDDEDRVDNSLLQIRELMIVHKAKLLFYYVADVFFFCRGYEVESWSRF